MLSEMVIQDDDVNLDDQACEELLRRPIGDVFPNFNSSFPQLDDQHAVRVLENVFDDPVPPTELLLAVKESAKKAVSEGPLPEGLTSKMAKAIYLTSIASALIYHGQKITGKADKKLRVELESLARAAWLPANMRRIVHEAIDSLSPEWQD